MGLRENNRKVEKEEAEGVKSAFPSLSGFGVNDNMIYGLTMCLIFKTKPKHIPRSH
jgi:hypothetical protein